MFDRVLDDEREILQAEIKELERFRSLSEEEQKEEYKKYLEYEENLKWPVTADELERNAKKGFRINNNYKCFMFVPNINFWYEKGYTLFFGWLFWGFDIKFK